MHARPELSVVVPCYNEQEVVRECYRRLSGILQQAGISYELIFVNDGSRDETLAILCEFHRQDSRAKILNLSRNFGQQLAISAGIEFARGDAVAIMDADLQDPPELLPSLLEQLRAGYDVVNCTRRSREGEGWLKLWTARAFYRLINRLSDTPLAVDTGDFRLMSRKAVQAMISLRETHRLVRGLTTWIGFRQTQLQYDRSARLAGKTKYPMRKMLNLALDGIVSFSTMPLRLVTLVGALAAALAGLGIVYALVLRLFTNVWVEGWTLLFTGMLFLGGLQLLSLGIVGEYIGRIYTECKRRPLFLVQEFLGDEAEEPQAVVTSATESAR
ncbi:MAG: glycosyltransferase family 2 protein [Acidobacteriia bacterium]|nr:glycosyltransferase family 2 protein [Terriglobia bacterium]